MRLAAFAILVATASSVHATPTGACETSAPRKTPHGAVSSTECGNAKVGGRKETINIDGVPVLTSKELYKEDSDDTLGLFVYTREADARTACPDRLFLIDASKRPVKVLAFGIQGACNQFESVKWNAKATVITLKRGVQFIFENGRLVAPRPGAALWKAIEPPHTGPGLAEAAALPFVEEVELPPATSASGH